MAEIFSYEAPWLIYGMGWSQRASSASRFRIALGSFLDSYTNKVSIVELNDDRSGFHQVGSFDHPYPTTKIQWAPDGCTGTAHDLVGTTGDYLRLWAVQDDGSVEQRCLLNNIKNTDFCAPLTSFDWNEADPKLVGTCSIDTTCTVWNIERETAVTQLIAHDREVYDMGFMPRNTDIFASVGADGSVRMFDLRALEHSTIIYESADMQPLLRLAWNRQDEHYLATFCQDSNKAVIIDVRVPSVAAAELVGHGGCLNGLAWAPHSSVHVCTVGDDSSALIWDVSSLPKSIEDPILAYNAEAEVNQLQWAKSQPDWIAITFDKTLQVLRV